MTTAIETETYTENDANGNPVTRTRQVVKTRWTYVAGEVDQQIVKPEIERMVGLDVAERDRLIHLRDHAGELAELRRRCTLGDPAADQLVERLAHVVNLIRFGDHMIVRENEP